jgi:hypothetical protein
LALSRNFIRFLYKPEGPALQKNIWYSGERVNRLSSWCYCSEEGFPCRSADFPGKCWGSTLRQAAAAALFHSLLGPFAQLKSCSYWRIQGNKRTQHLLKQSRDFALLRLKQDCIIDIRL